MNKYLITAINDRKMLIQALNVLDAISIMYHYVTEDEFISICLANVTDYEFYSCINQ